MADGILAESSRHSQEMTASFAPLKSRRNKEHSSGQSSSFASLRRPNVVYRLKPYTGVAMLPTALRSADSSKIGLSSPRTREKNTCVLRSAILLSYLVVLGLLVENLMFSLVALVLFWLENLHHRDIGALVSQAKICLNWQQNGQSRSQNPRQHSTKPRSSRIIKFPDQEFRTSGSTTHVCLGLQHGEIKSMWMRSTKPFSTLWKSLGNRIWQ